MRKILESTWTHRIIPGILAIIIAGSYSLWEIKGHPPLFPTSVSIEKDSQVSPKEPVIIKFSRPVSAASYNGKIKIVPSLDAKLNWSNGGKKLSIVPDQFWIPGRRYAVSLGVGKSNLFTEIDPAAFNFSIISYPGVSNFSPADETRDVILDIEDPIIIDFDKSTEDFFVKFDLDPPVEVTYQNNPEKTQFQLLPKVPAKEGQEYQVKVSAKYAGDPSENYKEIYTSSFQTLPPEVASWDKNFSVRVEQAKIYTRPKISEGKYIDINLTAQILSIFEGGKLLDSYLISTGKRGMETPKGTWAISNKTPRAWSKIYGLFMPLWMALVPSGKFGIHELPEWPGGYKEGANHLGTPVSHGCVRLGVGPAKRVYDWADMGTPVVVY
jgi:lipoprotein-anchoring transpeptidase ErfK/SrfK